MTRSMLLLHCLPALAAALSIGIDLGTSNSCCALNRPDAGVEMVPRRAGGGFLAPSSVHGDGKGRARLAAPDEPLSPGAPRRRTTQ